jgi:hypothetical protein
LPSSSPPPPAAVCSSRARQSEEKDLVLYSSDDNEEQGEYEHEVSSSSGTDDTAEQRERDRVVQSHRYNHNDGFEFCVDMCHSIKRILKEKIYPKVKILSDTEQQFLRPDFVGKPVDQSRIICETILRELDMDVKDTVPLKVSFWITYRSLVKNQLVKYRSNCVEDLKREYFRGKFCYVL